MASLGRPPPDPFAGRDRHGGPLRTNSAFVDYCWLSMHLQRQRPCLENASQCCCACGLSRSASSIGELRWRAGRFMHSSPASGRERVFRPPFHRVCPSGKMQSNLPEWSSKTLPFVKVARVVEWSSKTLPFEKLPEWSVGKKRKSRRTS